MADHTPLPWFRNGKYEVGPRPRTDDQSDGMLHPVADVFGDNREADAAFIVKAVNNHDQLTSAIDLLEKNAGIQAKLLADTERNLAEAVDLLDRLLGLKKGSGQAAFEFVEQYRARVGGSGK